MNTATLSAPRGRQVAANSCDLTARSPERGVPRLLPRRFTGSSRRRGDRVGTPRVWRKDPVLDNFWNVIWIIFWSFAFVAYLFALFAIVAETDPGPEAVTSPVSPVM